MQIIDTTGVNLNCNTLASFTVNQDTAILAVNPLTLVNKTNCSPGNGSATVVQIKEDLTNFPAGSGNYEFEWLDAASTTIPWPVNLVTLTDLDSGTFYVRARNITSNCESSFRQFSITQTTTDPIIAGNLVTPNSACGGLNSNGEVSISIANASEYIINWLEADSATALGVITTSAVISADTAATTLPPGKYVVQIIDTTGINLNCNTLASFTVNQDTAILAVNPLTLVNKTNCWPGNGSATVVDVKENSTDFPAGSGNYEFEWLDAASTTIPWPVNLVTLTDLDSGTFYVKARNITTNCESSFRQFSIIQNTVNPAIAASTIDPNSNCGGINPNGQVAISMGVPSGYDFTWLEADSTTALGVITTSAVISADTAATTLPPGKYVVQIIDTTGVNLNCNTTGFLHRKPGYRHTGRQPAHTGQQDQLQPRERVGYRCTDQGRRDQLPRR